MKLSIIFKVSQVLGFLNLTIASTSWPKIFPLKLPDLFRSIFRQETYSTLRRENLHWRCFCSRWFKKKFLNLEAKKLRCLKFEASAANGEFFEIFDDSQLINSSLARFLSASPQTMLIRFNFILWTRAYALKINL